MNNIKTQCPRIMILIYPRNTNVPWVMKANIFLRKRCERYMVVLNFNNGLPRKFDSWALCSNGNNIWRNSVINYSITIETIGKWREKHKHIKRITTTISEIRKLLPGLMWMRPKSAMPTSGNSSSKSFIWVESWEQFSSTWTRNVSLIMLY